ncbi:MAG TPA: outer membrane beta-barrel protein, partial [Bacteroidales bacterium]|nr:outer membrane beta-barrel protein [Bacteroidales bacterium]
MPGITSDGSTIKVHGEEVKKILVDGKDFFGDDPSATLKNLPADVVDKVQIFDKSSDQSQFTGFNEGDELKTLNIITKSDKRIGQFGRAYAGYGTDDKYNAGLILNHFDGDKRITILGMINNINQQNFNISDIMSLMGGQGGGRAGGPSFGRGGGAAATFFSGNQLGNTTTNALGINYIDNWGSRISVRGSYFFNKTNNTNNSGSIRNYYTENKLTYEQNKNSNTDNLNHRMNLRFEYVIDSFNTVILTPRITIQQNKDNSFINSSNKLHDEKILLSSTNTSNNNNNLGYNIQNDILYMHKFNSKGRSISFDLNNQKNTRNSDGYNLSSTLYNDTIIFYDSINQNYDLNSNTVGWDVDISYVEPISKLIKIQFSYEPSQTKSYSNKETYNSNIIDTILSNKYNNVYNVQRGGVGLRFNTENIDFLAQADVQQYELKGKQNFPFTSEITKLYNNILPSATLNYKFSKINNLNVRLRTRIRIPSIEQLQNVIDISNPLIIKAGNMDLRPTYENIIIMRLALANPDKAKNFFLFCMLNKTNNYISNSTYLLTNDTIIQGYNISKGSQFIIPINVDNYYSVRTFSVYSLPLKKIKSNLNLNLGYMYSHTPALLNKSLNYSDNNVVNGGFYLSSNINQNIDFGLSYNASMNSVISSIDNKSNNTYYNHNITFNANFIILHRFVLNTDINQITYSGLSDTYNQNYILWNAYIGYKLLKSKLLEAKLSVYDLLSQNRSINRTVTD